MIAMTLPEIADVVGGTTVHDQGVTVDGPAFLDSRVQTIYGGTTEIQKEIIGRSLGL